MTIKFPSSNERKFEIKTTGSSDAWILMPIAHGPFIMVSQHKYQLIKELDKGLNLSDIANLIGHDLQFYPRFDMWHGYFTYGAGDDGKYKQIAAYLDTSD